MASHRNPNRASKSLWKTPDGKMYPLKDAAPHATTLVPLTVHDCKGAIPLDPWGCALSIAWKRTSGAPAAQIGRDKAYLPIKEKGEWVVYRWKVRAESRRHLDHFDASGEFPPEGIWFHGIPASERLDSKRAQAKRARIRWASRAAKSEVPKTAPKPRPMHIRNASRRAQVFVQ